MTTFKRKGQSTQPCHGCGSTEPHWTGRVCDACAKAIKGYADIQAERAAAPDTVVMLGKERSYGLPHLHKTGSTLRDAVQNGFLLLQNALSTPVAGYAEHQGRIFNPRNDYRESDWDVRIRIRADHAKTLGDTYDAVRSAIDYAYADGHDNGRRLLMNLAAGTITNDEFNNQAARLGN